MLGLATVGIVVGAALAYGADDTALAGILVRVAAVLASVWLAYPALTRVNQRTFWLLGLAVVVVLIRPRSALVVLPVIAIFVRTTKPRRESAKR
jgi:hypothetical protein